MRDLSGQKHRLHSCPRLPWNRKVSSRWKKIAHLLLGLAVIASVVRLDRPVQAGTSLAITPSGKEVAWRAGTTITYHVDQGPLGTLSNEQAVAMVDELFALWQNVPTASLSIQRAGSLPVDVTASNYMSYRNNNADSYHPIIFDSDGSITDAIFGAGARMKAMLLT